MPFTRLTRPMLFASAAFVAAGGAIHLREWLDGYQDVPASAPGAAVVRIGFPVNFVVSALLAIGLVVAATKVARLVTPMVLAALAFEVGSLAILIGTRTGTVLGWTEPTWTAGADQSRTVEIGAVLCLVVSLVLHRLEGSPGRRASAASAPVPGRIETAR